MMSPVIHYSTNTALAIAADNAAEDEIVGSNFLTPTNFLWPLQIVLLF